MAMQEEFHLGILKVKSKSESPPIDLDLDFEFFPWKTEITGI